MLFNVDNKVVKAELRFWNGSSYDPDCLQDMEFDFIVTHSTDDNGCVVCSRSDFDYLVHFWEREVNSVNNSSDGDVLSLTSKQIKNGCEWSFVWVYWEV